MSVSAPHWSRHDLHLNCVQYGISSSLACAQSVGFQVHRPPCWRGDRSFIPQRWRLVSASDDDAPSHPSHAHSIAMVVTGADIPEELLDLICWYAANDYPLPVSRYTPNTWWVKYSQVSRRRERSGPHKRNLAICAQVCRQWAKHCRPLLFSGITLRSREDWRTFQQILLARPVTGFLPIGLSVTWLSLRVKSSDPPWAHGLQKRWTRYSLPRCTQYFLNSTSEDNTEHTTPVVSRFMHFSPIPFIPPGAFMLYTHVSLASVHFHDAKALFRILRRLHYVKTLSLYKLTFDVAPCEDIATSSSLLTALRRLRLITVGNNPSSPFLAGPLLSAFARAVPARATFGGDYAALGALLRNFLSSDRMSILTIDRRSGDGTFVMRLQQGHHVLTCLCVLARFELECTANKRRIFVDCHWTSPDPDALAPNNHAPIDLDRTLQLTVNKCLVSTRSKLDMCPWDDTGMEFWLSLVKPMTLLSHQPEVWWSFDNARLACRMVEKPSQILQQLQVARFHVQYKCFIWGTRVPIRLIVRVHLNMSMHLKLTGVMS